MLNERCNACGAWLLIGRFVAFRTKGRGFESRSSRHARILGKSFTRSCLWFNVHLLLLSSMQYVMYAAVRMKKKKIPSIETTRPMFLWVMTFSQIQDWRKYSVKSLKKN